MIKIDDLIYSSHIQFLVNLVCCAFESIGLWYVVICLGLSNQIFCVRRDFLDIAATAGSNKAASSGTSLNTRKLDEDTENLARKWQKFLQKMSYLLALKIVCLIVSFLLCSLHLAFRVCHKSLEEEYGQMFSYSKVVQFHIIGLIVIH